MTSQDRQQFWQQHIDAWQASDASLSVWLGFNRYYLAVIGGLKKT